MNRSGCARFGGLRKIARTGVVLRAIRRQIWRGVIRRVGVSVLAVGTGSSLEVDFGLGRHDDGLRGFALGSDLEDDALPNS
jgi:hypothetical protein